MNILLGIPKVVHHGIALAEVVALEKIGANVQTSFYGNSGEVNGIVKSLIRILRNALTICKKGIHQKSDIIYLNTVVDDKSVIRDSITIFLISIFCKNAKIVLKTHGTNKKIVLRRKDPLKNYILKKISFLYVLSKEEVNDFLSIGFRHDRISITANAIDSDAYAPDPSFRWKLNIESDKVVLLFVGRFVEEKGIIDLLEACFILKEKVVPFVLFCLGDGPLYQKVKESIKEYGLEDSIRLQGHVPEVEAAYFYSNCDVLILPSAREGFPMAVFQAIAAGKAIITTRVNACADYLVAHDNCLWVTYNRPEEIASKIIELKQAPWTFQHMKDNNLLLAKRFSADKIASELFLNFQCLLNKDSSKQRKDT